MGGGGALFNPLKAENMFSCCQSHAVLLGLIMAEKGRENKEHGQSREAGRGKERDSVLEPPEGNAALQML